MDLGRDLRADLRYGLHGCCSQFGHFHAQKHSEVMSQLVLFKRNLKYFSVIFLISLDIFCSVSFLALHFCPAEFLYIFEKNKLNSYEVLHKSQPSYLLKLPKQARHEPNMLCFIKLNTRVYTLGILRKKKNVVWSKFNPTEKHLQLVFCI